MPEIWKDISGFKGRYQISTYGRVKSLLRDKILSPNNNGKGYLSVQLGRNMRRLARQFNVSKSTISSIVNGKTWGWGNE